MRLVRESVDRFFDYGLHLETRTIYMGDGSGDAVDEHMAEKVIKAIHLLTSADPEKPIRVILNSFGGCWYNGMAIYDAIRSCPCHVSIEVLGSAMSMGSIILQAADERIIYPNATLMIHDGYETIGEVPPKTFEAWAQQSKLTREQMYGIYAERSGKPAKYWEKRCSHDYILSAEQAVSEGLADKIAGEEKNE
jgi:ATP-dependent Clp protease, protease subunit